MIKHCPKCGAEKLKVLYECGSDHDPFGEFDQSSNCRIRELEAALRPFAAVEYPASCHDGESTLSLLLIDNAVIVGDFRAARDAMEGRMK